MQRIPRLSGEVLRINPPKRSISVIISFALLMLMLSSKSHAQSGQDQWQLLKEQNGVVVYYQVSLCETQKVLHFKIKNDASPKSVIWAARVQVGDSGGTSLPSMQPKALLAEEEIHSSCANKLTELSLEVPDDFTIDKLIFNLFNI